MKTKLTLIVALAILVAMLVGCSKDEGPVVPLNALSALGVYGVNGIPAEYCTTLFAGQDIDAGTVCVEVVDTGDTETLYITYNTTGGWELVETHLWVGTALTDMPQTRKGNPKIGNFPYKSGDITGQTTYTFIVDLAQFGGEATLCATDLLAAAHAALQLVDDGGTVIQTETGWGNGDPMVERGSWATYFGIQFTCADVPPGQNSETAFAFDCVDALCFIDIPDEGFNRWGWTNGAYGPGTYYLDIYAGAGQCDITKGTLVGLLTVEYDGATATITYNTCGDYTMTETHLYVGNDILASTNDPDDPDGPGYTVAPGQYPYIHEGLDNVQTDVFTVDASGLIYVVAHAVVWGDYVAGDCGERGCVPPVQPCDEWILYGSNLDPGTAPLDDALYAYDLNNQTQTLVYDPTPIDGSQNYPNANAYDSVNQRIYFGTDDGRLYYHQIGSGTHVQVEGGTSSGTFGTMACGSFYDGKFYYVQNGTNRLYAVDIVADVATRTQVGTVPVSVGYGDIAFDPANPGRFIGSGSGKWYWYDLNDNTSATMTESGGDGAHKQLAYGSNGVLYGVNAVDGQFYTIVYDGSIVTLTAYWDSPYTYTDLASGPQCQ